MTTKPKKLLIENGTVITLGEKNQVIQNCSVLIEENLIKDFGPSHKFQKIQVDKKIDAKNKIVMPGFICGHHHFYSTFARGISVPGKPAKNFVEILEKLWWRLDNVLDLEDIYFSAIVAMIECIKNGTTTVIDHHESQCSQEGSLDQIEKASKQIGLRTSLCLGVSDRYARGKEGLEETEGFLKKVQAESGSKNTPVVLGMVGLHASFTVSDKTLKEAGDISKKYNTGIHIHCAEDIVDQNDSLKKYNVRVVERLKKFDVLGPKTILVHCVHIDEKEMNLISESQTNVVHNPESNMNNAVGCADVLKMLKKGINVGLGTDGMSSNMISQARVAYLLQRHFNRDPRVGFVESVRMLLENNSIIVDRISDGKWKVGEIKSGFLADVIVVDYNPPTPINEENFSSHLIFGIVNSPVDTVIVNGKIVMQNKKFITVNEEEILQISREISRKLWDKFLNE